MYTKNAERLSSVFFLLAFYGRIRNRESYKCQLKNVQF